MTDEMKDRKYMELALDLALKGCGKVDPNPLVGAVIVKDGKIIGSGYHTEYGKLHAEREALASCSSSPEGAVMYVTLEPCCHQGKQPPCTDAVIDAGISRVVIGSADPNPLVAGKGVEILKAHGIEVVEGDKSCVFPIHKDGNAVCGDEICDDDGWKDRHAHRRFEMDNIGSGEKTRT